MGAAPKPNNEDARLHALQEYNILDTLPERDYDDITQLASIICQTPIALISLVDEDRQWFKSTVGIDADETPRDIAFCAHTILDPNQPLIVPDATKDSRFADSDLVTQAPEVRFYAGQPLVNEDGFALGALCAVDTKPNQLNDEQKTALEILARNVVNLLELRKSKGLQNQLVDKLAESNENLTQFAYICSHDLQEPMRMVSSFSEKLRNHMQDYLQQDEKAARYMNFLHDGATRGQALVSDILAYSRLDNDTHAPESVHFNELVERITFALTDNLDACGGRITYDALPSVTGHKTQLYQLLLNLVTNGLKYVAEGTTPEITIRAEDMGDMWQFSVADNGIGMEERYLEKVFDVFKRLHLKGEYSGTGIGLAICKKVVSKHGGTIWVNSTLGKGSNFYFTLPKHS